MEETEGFEPSGRFYSTRDLANRCNSPLCHVSILVDTIGLAPIPRTSPYSACFKLCALKMVPASGIEPNLPPYQRGVLPSDTLPAMMVGNEGIEPSTYTMSTWRSTTELITLFVLVVSLPIQQSVLCLYRLRLLSLGLASPAFRFDGHSIPLDS